MTDYIPLIIIGFAMWALGYVMGYRAAGMHEAETLARIEAAFRHIAERMHDGDEDENLM